MAELPEVEKLLKRVLSDEMRTVVRKTRSAREAREQKNEVALLGEHLFGEVMTPAQLDLAMDEME